MVKFLAKEIIQDVSEIDRKGDFLMSLEVDKLDEMLQQFKLGKHEKSILGKWLVDSKKIMGERKLWKEAVQKVKCRQ